MTLSSSLKTLLIVGMGFSLLLVGCGKKAKTKDGGKPEIVRPPQTEIDTFLSKQTVSCEGNQACPNYIAKIVIVLGKEYKYCTGFLTDNQTVATSSSCLPSLLRLSGQDCSKDVYFFFPKTANRPQEHIGCRTVSIVSHTDGKDPILWRDDVAFLELEKPVSFRRQAQIKRDGIFNGIKYTSWMIDHQDEFSGIVKKTSCEAVHNNYVNPLSLNEASPNLMFADCPVTKGGTGAPVIDGSGKVRAMITGDMDPKLRTYLESTGLLTQPLKSLSHGTNFACAPTPYDNDMLDERECLKDLNYTRVDRARAEMLSTNFLFGELRRKYEDSLSNLSKFVRFGVKLIPKGDIQETEIYPKCFKPLSTWLPSMNGNSKVYVDDIPFPNKSFKRSMDVYGRIVGTTAETPTAVNFVQFSLSNLRSVKKSSILVWPAADRNDVKSYPNVGEECAPSSLL